MADNYRFLQGSQATSLAQAVSKRAVDSGSGVLADVVILGDSTGAPLTSASTGLPTTGRTLMPVKLDSTTGASGWFSLADLSITPGYLECQNRGTATMVIQIGGATGGDTTGAVETISALGTYVTPLGNLVSAKFFVSSGASAAALPYGGWKG